MTFTIFLFYLLSTLIILSAFRVITANNPIISVLHLILVFINISIIWILINAEFLALLLVLIYVGAVVVLFLFIVMMVDIYSLNIKPRKIAISDFIISLLLAIEILSIFFPKSKYEKNFDFVSDQFSNAYRIGYYMYTEYVFAVEISAILLLVGMISAISLSTNKNNKTHSQFF
ncbi:MAG: NADH-quinone oxidoreductase subunit J [Bordetella sp.]|nr:MAG: NADH-quinone oxidoreductase subunit J [Bordetella sp.]